MEENVKQPIIIGKIQLIDEKIENCQDFLSPILNQNNGKDSVEEVPIPKSLVLEKLDRTADKLDVLMSYIDIN